MKTQLLSIFARNRDKPFLVDAIGGGTLSFADVVGRAVTLASKFESVGICRGDRVGAVIPGGLDYVVFYLACLVGGLTAVPVNSSLSPRDRAFILSRARLAAVIASNASQDITAGPFKILDRNFLNVDADVTQPDIERRLASIVDDELLSIHFTSGTTNLPKGVAHRVGTLLGNASVFNETFGLGCERRFVHVMPMDYMAGFLNTLLCALMAEATLIIAPQFSAASVLRFWEPIVTHAGDMIWMSPTMIATLTNIDRDTVGRDYCGGCDVKIFSATAPLPLKLRREFHSKYGVDLIESYGLSELLLVAANYGPSGIKDGAVGCAIPDVWVEIRDLNGRPSLRNVDGSIFVTTPYVMVGYLDLNSGQPIPPSSQWFDTGDLGYLDDDGYLFVSGRHKDLIIRGGFNVSPRLIEETLLRHPQVENVAVVGVPHEYYGEEIVAAVIPKANAQLASFEGDLRALCRDELSSGAAPDRYISFIDFPVTQVGKVQKNKIREFLVQRVDV